MDYLAACLIAVVPVVAALLLLAMLVNANEDTRLARRERDEALGLEVAWRQRLDRAERSEAAWREAALAAFARERAAWGDADGEPEYNNEC